MELNYCVRYLENVIHQDIPALPSVAKKRIKRAIETRLAVDPVGFGKPLRYSLKNHRRLRVGDYRIIYRVDSRAKTVIVIAIKHRKCVYSK